MSNDNDTRNHSTRDRRPRMLNRTVPHCWDTTTDDHIRVTVNGQPLKLTPKKEKWK